jgi:magnesium-protoporphyrin O-methyltransferase
LLQAVAGRAQNLELSPAYKHQARTLATQAGVQGRLDWRLHDLAADPGAVEPADLVVLHRVVCCYPDYARLLAAAADHARAPWSSALHPATCSPAPSTGGSTW